MEVGGGDKGKVTVLPLLIESDPAFIAKVGVLEIVKLGAAPETVMLVLPALTVLLIGTIFNVVELSMVVEVCGAFTKNPGGLPTPGPELIE